jgi:hypothetical protein
MEQGLERRLHRRLDLQLPIEIKRKSEDGLSLLAQTNTGNVSLGGALCTIPASHSIRENELLQISLTVPKENQGRFPFTRLVGEARVVRMEPALNKLASPRRIALQSSSDIIKLLAA